MQEKNLSAVNTIRIQIKPQTVALSGELPKVEPPTIDLDLLGKDTESTTGRSAVSRKRHNRRETLLEL